MIATCTPFTVVSRSALMSLIITFMFEPAKLQMNWASASGTSTLRNALDGRPVAPPSAMCVLLSGADRTIVATSPPEPYRPHALVGHASA